VCSPLIPPVKEVLDTFICGSGIPPPPWPGEGEGMDDLGFVGLQEITPSNDA